MICRRQVISYPKNEIRSFLLKFSAKLEHILKDFEVWLMAISFVFLGLNSLDIFNFFFQYSTLIYISFMVIGIEIPEEILNFYNVFNCRYWNLNHTHYSPFSNCVPSLYLFKFYGLKYWVDVIRGYNWKNDMIIDMLGHALLKIPKKIVNLDVNFLT